MIHVDCRYRDINRDFQGKFFRPLYFRMNWAHTLTRVDARRNTDPSSCPPCLNYLIGFSHFSTPVNLPAHGLILLAGSRNTRGQHERETETERAVSENSRFVTLPASFALSSVQWSLWLESRIDRTGDFYRTACTCSVYYMNFKTSPFQNCLFQFRSFNLFSLYIQLYSLKQRSISQCFYVKYFLENEYITINTNKSLRSFRNGDRKNNIRQIESRDSMKDREKRVDKRVVMKINADNIWSEKRGRGGFSCVAP